MLDDLDIKAKELLATAYLLDGAESKVYLINDKNNGKNFEQILNILEERDVQENIALMGTILREIAQK